MHQHFGKRLVEPSGKPYEDDTLNRVYEQLFCDDVEVFRSATTEQTPPWSELLKKETPEARCKEIAEDDSLESRPRILAYRRAPTLQQHLFGVVVENFRDKTLNVVAA